MAKGFIRARSAAGKVPEVSVRVWLSLEYPKNEDEGELPPKAYDLEFDHLALVTRGACSPEDGCGIGMPAQRDKSEGYYSWGGESWGNATFSYDNVTGNVTIVCNCDTEDGKNDTIDLGTVPANPKGYGKDAKGKWKKPTLKDFTSKSWDELSEAQKRAIEACFAWKGGDTFGDLKLPHHRPGGTLVWAGVKAAMGALLGARGGVDIPSADKKKVYAHLAAHYKEFDKEPPSFEKEKGGENMTDEENEEPNEEEQVEEPEATEESKNPNDHEERIKELEEQLKAKEEELGNCRKTYEELQKKIEELEKRGTKHTLGVSDNEDGDEVLLKDAPPYVRDMVQRAKQLARGEK